MRHIAFMAGMIGALLMAGCATTGGPKETKPAALTSVNGTIPTLEPVTGYEWEQTKDAVTIKLAPVPFTHKVAYQRTVKEARGLAALFETSDGRKLYDATDQPHHLVVEPDYLRLKLHIVNNLSHVLRFHGAVLSMSADGKSLPLDETTQNELLRAVLTPYASLDVTISGPGVTQLPATTTLSFAIYDVITEVDAANNPTKRTTFEWIFSVRPQQIEEKRAVVKAQYRYTPEDIQWLSNNYIIEKTGQ